MRVLPSASASRLALRVERLEAAQHVERGVAGIVLLIVVVQRRVPERHDGVAHIFVDRALARR